MRPTRNSPRVLRTGQPLMLESIKQVCPAVFAMEPHSSRGERYRYVPTIEPLQKLLDSGWGVYEASQQRSRQQDRDPYTKHMLRLRKLDNFFDDRPGDHIIRKDVPEVILINAHDGTAAYHLKAGIFRMVCSNGLMVGSTLAGFTVRHTVGPATSMEVLEAGERIVVEQFPKMLDSIERFKGIKLNAEGQYRLAKRALDLRYPNVLTQATVQDFLATRRPEDEEPTLWNVLNRVQEHAIYGGWETRSFGFGRRTVARPVERVSAVTKINTGIWDEAEAIAAEEV